MKWRYKWKLEADNRSFAGARPTSTEELTVPVTCFMTPARGPWASAGDDLGTVLIFECKP